jgi:hypothetical protein
MPAGGLGQLLGADIVAAFGSRFMRAGQFGVDNNRATIPLPNHLERAPFHRPGYEPDSGRSGGIRIAFASIKAWRKNVANRQKKY